MQGYPEYLAAAFAVSGQPILMIERQSRRIIDLNPAAERLLGAPADQLRGASFDELVDCIDRSGAPANPGQAAEEISLSVAPRKGGQPCRATGTIAPVTGPDGTCIGEVMVLTPEVHGGAEDSDVERWQRRVSQSAHLACLVDAGGRFQSVSPRWAEDLGYRPEELLGRPMSELLHPDDIERTEAELGRLLATGAETVAFENRCRCKSGGYLWLSWYAMGDPATRYVYGLASDITERKRQERLLEETESSARIGGWELDVATNTLYWSAETYRLHDVTPEEYTPALDSALAFYSEDSVPRITEAVQRAIDHAEPFDLELELITAKGRRIACRAVGRAEVEDGEVARIFGSFQDVTEQRAVQRALHESKERLRTIVRDMSMGLVVQDPDGAIVMSNQAALDALGLTEDQILGKTSFDEDWYAIHEDGSPFPGETHPTMVALRTGESVTGVIMGVHRPRTKDRAWLLVNAVVQRDHGVEISRVVCSFIDITDRKRAEDAARENHAMFRAVYDNAGLGVLLRDAEGRLLECNPTFERMLGYSSDELRDMDDAAFLHPEDREVPADLHAELLAGQRTSYELERRFVRAGGELLWGHVTASLVREADGAPRYIVEMIMDITDRKQMEAQLLLADRMTSLGTMAAGVGHEINNPLTWLMGNMSFSLELLEEAQAGIPLDADSLDDIRSALTEALAGAERVRTIVRDLKQFSRMGDSASASADVSQVIQSTTRMLSNEINHRANLVLDLGEVPPVAGDEARLGQVLTNLLINAMQALPERSRDQNKIAVRTRYEGKHVVVEVSDNGAGIPPEVQTRIFDPFFTTKGVGEGTGLGLSICHSIVTSLGGRIELTSKPGQGTTFRISLAPVDTGARAIGEPADAARQDAKRKRILCIDDEPDVGRLIARILRKQHEVIVETDGVQALQRLRSGERYDAIICDLMMPTMSGMDFYRELRSSVPELAERCGFMTGGVFTAAARSFADQLPPKRLIEKPFRGQTIRELLGNLMS